jgi:subtilisin family serine protease
MKKFIYIIFALLTSLILVSCGGDKTAGVSSGGFKASAATAAQPKVTMQSVLAEVEKGTHNKGELLVKFKSGVSAKSAMRVHSAMGATVEKRFSVVSNLERVKLASGVTVKDAIVAYMQDPNVEYAEPNYIRYPSNTVPNDPYFNPQQWALQNTGTFAAGTAGADIKMPQAWDVTQGSRSIVVAVIDSGVDVNHPDLVNNIWRNPGETSCTDGVDNDSNGFIDDCVGWNFADKNNAPFDNLGHGTHVAGIIGAVGNNGAGITGVMWNVQIMPLKFITDLGPDVCGPGNDFCGSVDDEIAAIQYAINNGAKIINASFGSSAFSQAEFDAINAANSAGVLFIAAAGNGSIEQHGDNNDLTPSYPASHKLPNIISVAATDQNDVRAPFSNFGFNSVHIAAPGVYILSTIPFTGISASFASFCTGSLDADFDFCAGTSMATPHVVGLAGLLENYYTNFNHFQIRATILRYVDVLPTLQGWIQTGGRINAFKALSSLLTPTGLSANAQSSTQIALVWTDNATGEDGYKIERKVAGGDFVEIAQSGPNSTGFTDSGLTASSTYTYRVRAFNTIPADSAFSNEAVATTFASGSSTGTSGGGGGGCSIGRKQNGPTQVADALVMLAPLFAIIVLRNRRRKKK